MSKFRKKPVVIEAFQMTKERRWDNSDWPLWLHRAWKAKPGDGSVRLDVTADDESWGRLICGPEEFPRRIEWGDWIIRTTRDDLSGHSLDIYSCPPDVFEAEYEAVSDDITDTDAKTVLRAKLAGQALCGLLDGRKIDSLNCRNFVAEAFMFIDALMDRLDNTEAGSET